MNIAQQRRLERERKYNEGYKARHAGDKKLPHSVTLEYSGEQPNIIRDVRFTPYCVFQVDNIQMTDSFGGRATVPLNIFVGSLLQNPCLVPAAATAPLSVDFSLPQSLGRPTLDTCDALITMSLSLRFLDRCMWCATLSGLAFKREKDTPESLQQRAVDDYESRALCDDPGLVDVLEWQAMIRRMRVSR